jgi:hypothetical protein
VRSDDDVRAVFRLAAEGLTQAQVAAIVGVGQTTVSRWLRTPPADLYTARRMPSGCPDSCPRRLGAPPAAYAYLLGQYLGDGTIAHTRRGVYRLFVCCCAAYPGIVDEVRDAISAVMPGNAIGERAKQGAIDVTGYSKHWPCVFPQHGPGRKHTRPIVLEPWQASIALHQHPGPFVRGLIHSDGCRVTNRVRKASGATYTYTRYMFSNRSDDIRALFVTACEALDIEARPMGRYGVSVARAASVARLETVVGPKE